MNIYYNILKALLSSSVYERYNSAVNEKYLRENYPELNKVYLTIRELHAKVPRDYSVDDVEVAFYSLYPNSKESNYGPIFKLLRECEAKSDVVEGYLAKARTKEQATNLARTALLYTDGKITEGELLKSTENLQKSITESSNVVSNEQPEDFIDGNSFGQVQEGVATVRGFNWRLTTLNRYLGPIGTGDFGLVFARPETGKTTFLASEITYMAGQITDGRPVIWFNNEERGTKVLTRCYQASCGMTLAKIYGNLSEARQRYLENTKNSIKIPPDTVEITTSFVDSLCRKYNPALIIFDQIDKVTGIDAERYDLKMKATYAWARMLARTYGPVIGVCQAGGSAEGKKWLTMNDVDSSHTAKQGEVDWILGIGKTFDEGAEEIRYFHLCKNKLNGNPDMDESMRHGKWEVKILPEIARYEDY